MAWNYSPQVPPPRDGRLIVAKGNVIGRDEFSTYSDPFLEIVKWHVGEGWAGWTSQAGLAVSCDIEATVTVWFWSEVPEAHFFAPAASGKPEAAASENPHLTTEAAT